ncbi:MAG: hypothetical protein A3J37_05795 [Alphaproteobacteria bacterium RIFCSPHIGHO2_12_FULL_45_9]|nr:MAG: hypothetical protein A3B66_04965 [Alphaproteobacteria bacterium RIFCSPHIGHO2_02_FULL_46_13]OFW94911.1 MAG: hypothetical protein A3J37_05795 [Alphaproteobacteria bacterium RIFCSPHIGHO2_12_FULL_45_9]
MAGWQPLPDVLLKNQYKLELTPTEIMVLINVLSFWWYADQLPYPTVSTIAKRMNVTTRTIQRSLSRLIQKKLLERKTVETNKGNKQEVYDPEGLVKQLEAFAVTDKDFLHRQERKFKQTLEEETNAKRIF